VVVGHGRQASIADEIDGLIARIIFSTSDIYIMLAETAARQKAGKKDDFIITVSNATGIAIQEIAAERDAF